MFYYDTDTDTEEIAIHTLFLQLGITLPEELISEGLTQGALERSIKLFSVEEQKKLSAIRQLSRIPVGKNPHQSIRRKEEAFEYFRDLQQATVEKFKVLALDGRGRPIDEKILFIGGKNAIRIDTKVIFAYLLSVEASAFIIGHNHPVIEIGRAHV